MTIIVMTGFGQKSKPFNMNRIGFWRKLAASLLFH
jgi:hypothetical protein